MAYTKSEAGLLITVVLLGQHKNATSPAGTLPPHRANSTTHSSSWLPWPVTATLQPSTFWSPMSAGSGLGHAKIKIERWVSKGWTPSRSPIASLKPEQWVSQPTRSPHCGHF